MATDPKFSDSQGIATTAWVLDHIMIAHQAGLQPRKIKTLEWLARATWSTGHGYLGWQALMGVVDFDPRVHVHSAKCYCPHLGPIEKLRGVGWLDREEFFTILEEHIENEQGVK